VVLSTEHVYKNPKRAFEFMKKFQPEGVLVVPGMEYVTKEGVDIIVFSKSESIYSYKELFPLEMTLNEFLDFVDNHNDLYTFLTHPYLKSKTGIVHNLGYKKFQDFLKRVNALEVISGNALKQKIFKYYLETFYYTEKKGFQQKINTPEGEYFIERGDYNPETINFIAVGSDAHQFGEVGNHLILKFNKEFELDNVFKRIIDSRDGEIFVRPRMHNLQSLIQAP